MASASAGWGTYLEVVFALGLAAGTAFGVYELRRSHDLLLSHETALASASGALADVIAAQFEDWGLTPAEKDVAMFALKGFDLSEIARLRGAAQGTVRAQMAAVYAKSGTSGRAQFAAFFVEDLLAGKVGGPDRADDVTKAGS
ncbi:helix-turn-helix transcriptional regulator [Allgaiera indica]|nr:helix-turn-helix transcriptional regulator [Allgaiera indica]